MDDKKSNLFRKDAVERMNSPEKLDEYLRVVKPSTWIVILMVLVFLIGFSVWSIFGRVDTIISTAVYEANNRTFCLIRAEDVSEIEPGMIVKVNDESYQIVSVNSEAIYVKESEMGQYLLSLANLSDGELAYTAELSETDLPQGIYSAEIIIDSISPFSLIFN